MKAIKIIVKTVVCLVVLLLAAVLALPLWFGSVAKTVANAVVPGIVKTDFRMGRLSLNPYTARFELGDLNLSNPKGYSVADAVRVGDMIFDAETLSLMTDVIHIEEITVRDLFVSVVSGGENNVLNFKQIQYNVAGGKEKHLAAQSEKEANVAAAQDASPSSLERKPEAEKRAKKIVIDRLEISGLTIQLSVLPIKLPSIVLTDIGRKTGGATFDEAWQQILDGIMKSAGIAGEQLKVLGALTGDAAKKANETVNKATAQATMAVDGATKQISTHTEKAKAVVDGVSKQLSAIPVASKTADAAAGVINGSTDAVNDSVKKASEGAKKAMDSLKKLW